MKWATARETSSRVTASRERRGSLAVHSLLSLLGIYSTDRPRGPRVFAIVVDLQMDKVIRPPAEVMFVSFRQSHVTAQIITTHAM